MNLKFSRMTVIFIQKISYKKSCSTNGTYICLTDCNLINILFILKKNQHANQSDTSFNCYSIVLLVYFARPKSSFP